MYTCIYIHIYIYIYTPSPQLENWWNWGIAFSLVFLGRWCKSWKLLSRAGRELDFFRVLALRGNVFCGFSQHLSNASAVFSLAFSSLRRCDLPKIASHARRGARKSMLLAQRGNAIFAFDTTSAARINKSSKMIVEVSRVNQIRAPTLGGTLFLVALT